MSGNGGAGKFQPAHRLAGGFLTRILGKSRLLQWRGVSSESAGPLYPVADGTAAVKVWAETIMRTRLEAMRAGKLDELEAVVRGFCRFVGIAPLSARFWR